MFRYIVKIEYLPDGDDPGVGILRLTYDDGKTYNYQCTREVVDVFVKELKKTI